MGALAQRVATVVYQHDPRAVCFTCIAARHGLKEHDVRAVALVLITRHGLQLARRICSSCGRDDEVLVAQQAA